MGRGKYKSKPTGRRQFSTPEDMRKQLLFLFFRYLRLIIQKLNITRSFLWVRASSWGPNVLILYNSVENLGFLGYELVLGLESPVFGLMLYILVISAVLYVAQLFLNHFQRLWGGAWFGGEI